jgi:TPR repeat protein
MRPLQSLVFSSIIIFAASNGAAASDNNPTHSDFEKTVHSLLYQSHEYDKALSLVRPLAAKGDPTAQFLLGMIYFSGVGLPKDEEKAAEWFRKASEQGLATASSMLAEYYSHENSKDDAQFIAYSRKAAEQGDTISQVLIGNAYTGMWGYPVDPREMVRWFSMAAERGDTSGMMALASAFKNGYHVPVDIEKAIIWFRTAADAGDSTAMWELGKLSEQGIGLRKSDKEAFAWYLKAAQHGNSYFAAPRVAQMYDAGIVVPVDYAQAALWYAVAARGNDAQEINLRLKANLQHLQRYRVTTSSEIRSNADAKADVIRTAKADEIAYKLSESGIWYEVYLKDGSTIGFVSHDALSLIAPRETAKR